MANNKLLLSVVLVLLRIRGIPSALGCHAYLSVWGEEGALCVGHLAVFVPPPLPHPLLSTVYIRQVPVFLGEWGLMAG